jgi:glycolate oxidase FAD binding subunit
VTGPQTSRELTGPAVDRLGAACPGGPADPADQVAGVPAGWLARPQTVQQAGALMAACDGLGLTVVARGGGSKLNWAAPPACVDVLVDTTGLDRLEHTAGDLVVTVGAGLALSRLQHELGRAGQELALDQPLAGPAAERSTLGGIVSTAVTGPRRLLRGSPRDLVIGATLVRADGVIARSGGRVVKNVAGYDLGRLVCGGYGTLGLIAELTFRLHPVAPARCWVQVAAGLAADAARLTRIVLDSPVVPSALELDRPGPGQQAELTALIEGTQQGVPGRAGRLAALLGPDARVLEQPPDGWGLFPGGPDDVLVKLTADLPGMTRLLAELDRPVLDRALLDRSLPVQLRGSIGAGVLHVALPAGMSAAELTDLLDRIRPLAARAGGSVVVLRAPAAIRAEVDLWGPIPSLPLMIAVKDQFDPGRRLAPGRFVGGI